MANIPVRADDGLLYLVPEGTPPEDADKGIPLYVDLSFLNFPVYLEQQLIRLLANRGLKTAADFEKPGAYAQTADALRELLKVSANEIVDHIRRS